MKRIHAQKFATKKWLCFFLVCFAVPVCFAASNYRVTNGTTQTITEASVCKKVTNNAGMDVFVPTNSGAEWSSFYSAPPSGVAIAECATYHLTPTGRVAPFYDVCYYAVGSSGWAPMRCSQPSDVGQIGTVGGCQMNYGTMTTADIPATTLWQTSYYYNWETVYKCEYY